MLKSKIIYSKRLPKIKGLGEQVLLIVDRAVLTRVKGVRAWTKSVDAVYVVDAGERLKDLTAFSGHVQKILDKTTDLARGRLTIVAVGGGSVGDFSGFVASVLKRGVRLVHIPSTWLSAMDSAHGGKTALNVKGLKNAIGTFYPAEEIYICEDILKSQNHKRAEEAAGELAKMVILSGGPWVRRLKRDTSVLNRRLLKNLREAIKVKYAFIERDPYDQNGVRAMLNLGHTFGHVIEAVRGVPHGLAVAQGIYFSLKWSLQTDGLNVAKYFEMTDFLRISLGLPCWIETGKWQPIRESQAIKFLVQDKKRISKEKFKFIFVKDWGKTQSVSVTIRDILKEARRQGWVSP